MGYGPAAPVPIFQHQAEFQQLLDLYKKHRPRRVLEIGTYHGGTLYHWLQHAPPRATIVSVDSYQAGVDNRHLYPGWKPATVRLHTIEGDSHHPATIQQVNQHGPYDWVFIDAGHRYRDVSQDWDNYGRHTTQIAALHDILPGNQHHPDIEVSQLWQEIRNAGHHTLEIVENPDALWGGIGVVFLDPPPDHSPHTA